MGTRAMLAGRIGAGLATATALLLPGALLAQASPSDFTYATRYDAARRVTGTIAPDPDGTGPLRFQAVRNTYDAAGLLTKVQKGQLQDWQAEGIAPSAWSNFSIYTVTEITYDVMSRKTSETVIPGAASPGAGVRQQFTQFSYNNQGLPECTAVRMNPAMFGSLATGACTLGTQGSQGPDRITRNVYDAAGQLVTVQKAYGTVLQQNYAGYEYTLNGKRKAVIDARGNRAEMRYDGHDRQDRWTFPSKTGVGAVDAGDYEEYAYDANGNRTSLRKRDARTIAYAYDALNRVTSKTYPQGGARAVHYGYDLRGLQTAARFDSTTGADAVTSSWNGFGEQASSTTAMAGTSRTLNYASDLDGNRVQMTYPDGTYANYYRDGLDRMHAGYLTASTPLFYLTYDPAGPVSVLSRWVGGAWSIPTTYGYEGISRLSNLTHDLAGTTADVTSTFAYNPASQVVTRTRSNDAYAFTGYINVSRSYAANGQNQYTTAGPASFGYDANGNLTSDGTKTYGYDIENRLVSVRTGLQLTWDPTGRLFQTSGSGLATTRFLYDGDALVAEYDGAGMMLNRYVHSDGDDDPLVWYSGSGTASPRYLYVDHQGSVEATADSGGNLLATNAYDEYGITKNSANGAIAPYGRFGYTGQAWIPELGMYHYKARIYSPTLGRFLQTDPIGYDDQVNLYAYVANDPVNNRDPDGEAIETVWDLANIAMGVASAGANIATGNYGRAAVDIAGALVDTAAAVVPGVPGGAGTAIRAVRGAERGVEVARASGRAGRQARLRELAGDTKLGRADRGWIKQEMNSITRGQRSNIRNPPGKNLAHERGREAAKGYDYKHSKLQDRDLHITQHKFDDFGRRNKERPID